MVRSFFVGQLSDSGQIFGEKVSAAGRTRGAAIFIRLCTRIFFAQRQRGATLSMIGGCREPEIVARSKKECCSVRNLSVRRKKWPCLEKVALSL